MPLRAVPLALALVLLASACKNSSSSTYTENEVVSEAFPSVANPRLVVETFRGRIEVTGSPDPDIAVEVTKAGTGSSSQAALRDLRFVGVGIQREGGTIQVVAARSAGASVSTTSAAHVAVRLPAGASINIKTADGEITVTGMAGGVIAETENGPITIAGGRGQVSARTKNGEIRIDGELLTVEARTENGSIGFSGSLSPAVSQMRSGNGAITVDLPPSADFRLEASTITGTVTCAFNLPGADNSAKTNLFGATSTGAKTVLALHTNNGNISIR
ncbi:MAG: DUF4097 family beta strand repeat protein [Dehalococcoidia bacterium]|nr:MAG: hypothetical protein EDM76_01440 [bacterium]MCE7927696.1 hypothetical protein [Chloroflexi bacterium CFX7]MCK6563195.1 DUF4097 domain-containing protein [Dehalococcoidia bacterium]MCL4232507.1 DUF4097 family beta strand repeat protein [Dehalococcoidia bacterium]NUQ55692.1 DUF4097 family beta strand repeat protein [Dehalococcoidia bacterium]